MTDVDKIKLLNRLLAFGSPSAHDIYADAAFGVNAALADMNPSEISPRDFAQNMLRLYDSDAAIEVVEIKENSFDPLFALPEISSAVKRISGFKRAVLVIYGLDRTDAGRASAKKRRIYAENIDFIEDYVMRYADSFPNLEILFI